LAVNAKFNCRMQRNAEHYGSLAAREVTGLSYLELPPLSASWRHTRTSLGGKLHVRVHAVDYGAINNMSVAVKMSF
jgi:hypothetical protein